MHLCGIFEGHAVMAGFKMPEGEPEEWLETLKPYQRNTLEIFLEEDNYAEAAERWVAATGSPNIVPFGGNHNTKPFWDQFKTEFRKFICDDDAYTEEKQELAAESGTTRLLLVSTISASVGATIGFAATLLAPAVALMLCAVSKMGRNAFCASNG